MLKEDYLERLIAQVAQAVARILALADVGDSEQIERDIASTWSSTIGFRRADVDRLDEGTLGALLGDKRLPAAMLLEGEAEMRRKLGQDAAATRLASLAAKLRR